MAIRELLTVAEVRALDASGALSTISDAAIQEAITDVSVECYAYVRHDFPYNAAKAIEFKGDGTSVIDFSEIAPLAGVPTSITNEYGTNLIADTDYLSYTPTDAPHDTLTYHAGFFYSGQRVIVTGNWGWATIPDDVKRAAFRLVKRYLLDSEFMAAYQGTGSTSQSGNIKTIKSGQQSMEVTFGDAASSAIEIGAETTGDGIADKLLKKYRRGRLSCAI